MKTTLLGQWQDFGRVLISDMPNGFMLIRCESDEVKQNIIFGRPWNVSGLTLQVSLWQPNFEPATIKLSKAMVWLQLHNLLVDLWEGEALEAITEPIGKLLKVDDFTSFFSRARFARVCLEIDLLVTLKRGFLLDDKDGKVFVLVLCKCLPTFCYCFGLFGHGSTSCGHHCGFAPTKETGIAHSDSGVDSDPRVLVGQTQGGDTSLVGPSSLAPMVDDSNTPED